MQESITDNSVNKSFRVAWVLYLIYLIERPLLNSRSLDVVVMVVIALVLYGAVINSSTFSFSDILIFIVIGINMILSLIYGEGVITLSLAKAIFCFFMTYMLMVATSRSRINKYTFDFVFICSVLASILFIVYYFTPIAYIAQNSEGERYISDSFTCNLRNPNYTGIVLYVLFGNLLINLKFRKNKVLLLLLIFAVVFLIWKTKSRTCFLSVILTVLFYISYIVRHKNNNKVNKTVILLIMLIPILFIWIYLSLYYSGFQNVVILNKPLFSGREMTFVESIENVNDIIEVLIGNIFGTQLGNAHNGPLAIFTSTGLIGLILIYALYVRSINDINKGTLVSSMCVVCILGIFIHSSAEATFMIGSTSSMIGIGSLFFLSSYNEKSYYCDKSSVRLNRSVMV